MNRIAITTACLLFCSILPVLSGAAPPPDINSQIGRYQLMFGADSDLRIFLLDTATGQCWSKSADGLWVDEGNPVRGQPPSRMASKGLALPHDKVEVTIKQRHTKSIPVVADEIQIALEDITRGQVMLTIRNREGDMLLDKKSVRAGDVLSFKLKGQDVYVRVAELQNYLVGEDYGIFELSGIAPKVGVEDKAKPER